MKLLALLPLALAAPALQRRGTGWIRHSTACYIHPSVDDGVMTDAFILYAGRSFPTSCYTTGQDAGGGSDKGNFWFFNDRDKCWVPYAHMAEDVPGLPRCDTG